MPTTRRKAALAIGLAALAGLALALLGPALIAQIEGDRGIAPIASTGDFEVDGIDVDVTGKDSYDARQTGWREAQKLGWQRLWKQNGAGGAAPALSDDTIDSMVSAVVVQKEEIGPRRYIATLGVIFDRARTGALLGLQGERAHSAPMLVIPVLYEGGASSVFEWRTPWQKAWADYHTGTSVIDYVRPNGAGADSLLLNAGQIDRRSRTWWRLVLDEFGAADVVMPLARVERQWPGGPVKGTFTARFGPDNRYLGGFSMTADSDAALPRMFEAAITRLDGIYAAALADGRLAPDQSLNMQQKVDPALIAQILDQQGLTPAASATPGATATSVAPVSGAQQAQTATYTVQFVTPEPAAVDAGLGAVRSVSGVKSVSTSSIAIGGTSVMRVTYEGGLDELAAALRAKGWQVTIGAGALSIRK
ncbi:MAG: heavy-metal-associated domain-containing protein [Sphingomonadales bacterium]|nr:heavy-metal-associated domain-containing protein [Sphingomonadales bacterium]MDE2567690.1 heavy-metal-associated domain-containing protein [Sphingomonadales bacterium]